MKVLCDQMLGSLATWLRFLGIDTFYVKEQFSDDDLLKIARKEKRILITKDKELIIRANKINIPIIAIQSSNLDDQLFSVISEITIDKKKVLSRCSLCNNILVTIKKEEIKKMVPSKVYQHNSQFWRCSHCKKIYWKGSHYDEIMKKITSLQ
jgi:uncharacterized protein with PIN domain